MKAFLGALCACLLIATAHAATDVAGVKFDDRSRLGEHALVLNGAGVRTKFFFKVYAMALYLPATARDTAAVLAMPGARQIDIVTLRELTAAQLAEALADGLRKNLDATALTAMQPRIDRFTATMLTLGEAKEGTRIGIDFVPDRGTAVRVNGAPLGEAIEGRDFSDALLKVWLGEAPAQADLKQSLLGGTAP